MLEDAFLERGVRLLKGARASAIDRLPDGVRVHCNDGRVVDASHVVLAVGSIPNTQDVGLDVAGVDLVDLSQRAELRGVEFHCGPFSEQPV